MQKDTLKSKTARLGIATIIGGAVAIYNGQVETGIQAILYGLTLVFFRDTAQKFINEK